MEILFGIYGKYARRQGWDLELLDTSHGNQGGFREINFVVIGNGAFGHFQHESGTHKIQRISPTDPAKRMHTSAATVVVLPEIKTPKYQINKQDVRMDKMCSGLPGGQNVNKVETAIRLLHEPTGIMVRCEGRSQHQNILRAWEILTSRIDDYYEQQELEKQANYRKQVRGSGDRSQRIRTYNFPQDRVTDHRIKKDFHLDKILSGHMDQLINDLKNVDFE